jgi:hypothetical protein
MCGCAALLRALKGFLVRGGVCPAEENRGEK